MAGLQTDFIYGVWTCTCHGTHVGSEDSWESVLSFYHVGSKDQTQVVRLGGTVSGTVSFTLLDGASLRCHDPCYKGTISSLLSPSMSSLILAHLHQDKNLVFGHKTRFSPTLS